MIPDSLLASSQPHPAGYRDVAPHVALAHLAKFRVIDVREAGEFTGPLGHVSGAELVPLATVAAAATGWDRSRPLLVVCRSGGRSGRAAATLATLGFQNVFNVTGGMLAWDAHALPREGDASGAASPSTLG